MGGQDLFKRFSSVRKAVMAIDTDYSWDSTHFIEDGRVRRGYWTDPLNRLNFLNAIAEELQIVKVRRHSTVLYSVLQLDG